MGNLPMNIEFDPNIFKCGCINFRLQLIGRFARSLDGGPVYALYKLVYKCTLCSTRFASVRVVQVSVQMYPLQYTFRQCTYLSASVRVVQVSVQMYPVHYIKNVPSYMFARVYVLHVGVQMYPVHYIKKYTYYTSGYKCTLLRVGYSKMASP